MLGRSNSIPKVRVPLQDLLSPICLDIFPLKVPRVEADDEQHQEATGNRPNNTGTVPGRVLAAEHEGTPDTADTADTA